MTHWLLVAMGWLVVAWGGLRTYCAFKRGEWARGARMLSWVILAGAISLFALIYDGPRAGTGIRVAFVVGLGVGSFGLIAGHFIDDEADG